MKKVSPIIHCSMLIPTEWEVVENLTNARIQRKSWRSICLSTSWPVPKTPATARAWVASRSAARNTCNRQLNHLPNHQQQGWLLHSLLFVLWQLFLPKIFIKMYLQLRQEWSWFVVVAKVDKVVASDTVGPRFRIQSMAIFYRACDELYKKMKIEKKREWNGPIKKCTWNSAGIRFCSLSAQHCQP